MSEVPERATKEGEPGLDGASDELARSLGSVWKRFSGQRPKSASVEIEQDIVRCVIEERPASAEPDVDATPDDDDPRLTPAGLKQNATAAVTRITGRRVVAFIAKHDKGSDVSTQTFLLDQPPRRF